MSTPLAYLPKVRSLPLMQAIRGMPCSLRLATFLGQPCSSPETVVGCHLPVSGKGMGTKVSDIAVAAGCARCHDLLDGRDPKGIEARHLYPHAWNEQLLRALVETQARLVESEVITVKGMQIE